MENRNNEHIDDFICEENKGGKPNNEEKKSNYFNDYTGASNGFSSPSPYDKTEDFGEPKNREQTEKEPRYFDYSQRQEMQNGANNVKDEQKFSSLGKVSMVLGIVSVVSCCFAGMPIFLACMAIVLSCIRTSVKADGFAIAGLVTGIVGFLLNALVLIGVIFGEIGAETAFTSVGLVYSSLADGLRAIVL